MHRDGRRVQRRKNPTTLELSDSSLQSKYSSGDTNDFVSKDIAPLKTELKEKSIHIINEIFPKKALELSNSLENDPIFKYDIDQLTQLFEEEQRTAEEENRKKRRKINEDESVDVGNVSSDFSLNDIISKTKISLKKEAAELLKYLTSVRLWIQLNVPRIEDGNNFGVQVQEDMIHDIGKAEENTFSSIDLLTKYHVTRGKMLSKCLKYPQVQDYKESIKEIDQKYYTDIITGMRDIRNHYAGLYDSIQKNLEKIVKPRSSHTAAMF